MTSTTFPIIDGHLPETVEGQTFAEVAKDLWDGQHHDGPDPIKRLSVFEVGGDELFDSSARMLVELAEMTFTHREVPAHLAQILWQSGQDVFVPEEDRGPDPDWRHDHEVAMELEAIA